MKRVAILDYGMGNLRSVAKALQTAGADVAVTSDAGEAAGADALCVPGQGIFGRCMDNLSSAGVVDLVRDWISGGRPYLGICLGMQILFEFSEESGGRPGMGLFPGKVARLRAGVRVPHIGWNVVSRGDRTGGDAEYFYFDHSYAVQPGDPSAVVGWCTHGTRFAAWVERGAVTAVQFHPEKSSRAGIALLARWLQA